MEAKSQRTDFENSNTGGPAANWSAHFHCCILSAQQDMLGTTAM
jgi:hypothetical protein